MFGLGFSEILIIGVIALIVLGPDQLPELARTLGRFLNELKRSTESIKDDLKSQVNFDLDERRKEIYEEKVIHHAHQEIDTPTMDTPALDTPAVQQPAMHQEEQLDLFNPAVENPTVNPTENPAVEKEKKPHE